jgi:hypothetical protein
MRERWCHDHKTWTSRSPVQQKELRLENIQGSLQFEMPDSNSETRGRFYDGLGSNTRIVAQYSVCPIITLDGRITASGYVDKLDNRCIPRCRHYFRTKMRFSKNTMPSLFTNVELFSHSVKAWRWTSTSSLARTITRLEYNWIILVSFGD